MMKLNEGRIGSNNDVLVDRPAIELFDVEVQHPVGRGNLTLELGTIGAGIVMQPTGNPRVILMITHPDNTGLSVILNGRELHELISLLADANRAAGKAQQASVKSTRQ